MTAPGGRTRSIKLNGSKFDLGAQWVGPQQKFVQDLGKRAKNELILQNPIGSKII
jgi:predicted NAD/FAD-dependent oxidoreductase